MQFSLLAEKIKKIDQNASRDATKSVIKNILCKDQQIKNKFKIQIKDSERYRGGEVNTYRYTLQYYIFYGIV